MRGTMVTYEQTKRKYHGRMAEGYEAKRKKQERWTRENEVVSIYLHDAKGPLLDVPVGTGRYLDLYQELGIRGVHGVDASETMLALARKKRGSRGAVLVVGDATDLGSSKNAYNTAVCVRFLDLVPEETMRKVLAELCRVTERRIVLTIRLGEEYINKSNTCTHDRKKFYRDVKRHGWTVYHATPVFNQGWEVVQLRRA
jgi:ubiquinone/menaquinone biosynthesis C-methylase UbiE